MQKIWLVEHPITKYEEDVLVIAARENLAIVDPKCGYEINHLYVTKTPPKLTIKDSKKPRKTLRQKNDSSK